MGLHLLPDIDPTVKSLLVGGQYQDETAVLHETLASLMQREVDLVEIREGIADAGAGHLASGQTVLNGARKRLGRLTP